MRLGHNLELGTFHFQNMPIYEISEAGREVVSALSVPMAYHAN